MLLLVALPAISTNVPQAAAQTNTLTLSVISARSEFDAPGGPVLKGDPVTEYKYLINKDNTGDHSQAKNNGCTAGVAGYPDSCDWPSVREVPGAAPIFTQGDQDDFNGVLSAGIVNLPAGKYLTLLRPYIR